MSDHLNDSQFSDGVMDHLLLLLHAVEENDARRIAHFAKTARAFAEQERPKQYNHITDLLNRYGW